MGPIVNRIAAISSCWGILLASFALVFVVIWSPSPPDAVISGPLFSQALLLALGCTQTVFSVVLFTTTHSQIKRRWTTVWICTHVFVAVGLIFFLVTHDYMMTAGWEHRVELDTLDLVVICDFIFLVVAFVSLLWIWNPMEEDEVPIENTNNSTIPTIATGFAGTDIDNCMNPSWAFNPIYGRSGLKTDARGNQIMDGNSSFSMAIG